MIHYHLYQKPIKTYFNLSLTKIILIFLGLFISYGIIDNYSDKTDSIYTVKKITPHIKNIALKNTPYPNSVLAKNTPNINNYYKEIYNVQEKISNMLAAKARLEPKDKKFIIGKGDTLAGLLVNKANIPSDDAYRLIKALEKIYDPKDIVPGYKIRVSFNKNSSLEEPKLKDIYIEKDLIHSVNVSLNSKGEYRARKISKAVYKGFKAYNGTINNSLYVDAKAKGVPDSIIIDLIKMYSWNVDFQREIRHGDKFEVLYEQYRTKSGQIIKAKGKVIYAKLTLRKRELPFYRFKDKSGFVDYYDASGRSAKKALMKTPINGARLSSGFGMRRHPVLGYSKMHKGIDFAAPRGTPIYAAGDGIIEKARRFGTFGNYIKIRHRTGLETAYAHMQRFNKKIRKGIRVKQGQIIGYVGTTGRSTGPHLHYEVLLRGRQVNPSSVKLPLGNKLSGNNLKHFNKILRTERNNFRNSINLTQIAKK